MKFGLRELIFLVVLIAVPAVSLLYVFQPRNREIDQKMKQITEKRASLELVAKVNQEIKDMEKAIIDGQELIGIVYDKLPGERGVEDILEQVWEITDQNALTVKSVKTEKPKTSSNYSELPLKMVVEGNFDGFYQFLLELENIPRITRIKDMKVEGKERTRKEGGGGRTGEMKAEFVLSIYFEPRTGPSAGKGGTS